MVSSARRTNILEIETNPLRVKFSPTLNQLNIRPGFPALRSSREQSAGLSVSAFTVERHSAIHIVTANCL